ncbi:class I SAM-dependent methyltransferase [Candidatus Berkelbacteria bacterium]|nr:class I SAM-dependent methyltransferase [Candidatus Berkelbacteria bacterium]
MHQRLVINCYNQVDLFSTFGLSYLSEGIFSRMPETLTEHTDGQQRKINYLLDQVNCQAGTRLLDIGCGYGNLLETARERGAEAVGITISRPQLKACQNKGLDVRLLDYRELNLEQFAGGKFSAVIANGSIEHFVSVEDAIKDKSDRIYSDFFGIVHNLLIPKGRLATTSIHQRDKNQFNPRLYFDPTESYLSGSVERHVSNLVHAFGGWYPDPDQLERAAARRFQLMNAVNGTNDYRLTSEFWLKFFRSTLLDPWLSARLYWRSFWSEQVRRFRVCIFNDESWNWQFRGDPPPMQLLRQTWQKIVK